MNSLSKTKTVSLFQIVISTTVLLVSFFSLSGCNGGGDSPAPAAPKILTQPSNQSVRAGETTSFSVVATGDGNLAYQWRRNGVDVAGANAATYAISSPQLPDTASVLTVAVSNVGGTVVSNGATLTVKPALGISLLAGSLNIAGNADGFGANAGFSSPRGLAVDKAGNVYVVDGGNATIRKISPVGAVTTIAGVAGVKGSADGLGAAARFTDPQQIAVDKDGNLYVTDNNTVRKILPNGTVTTVAGLAGAVDSLDGVGADARFADVRGIAVDVAGNLYVADRRFNIRKITPTGMVTTFADEFGPKAIAVDSAGNLVVSESLLGGGTTSVFINSATVARLAANGTTIIRSGSQLGVRDGSAVVARFADPVAIAVDAKDNAFVADSGASAIRKVTSDGTVTTVAGNGSSPAGVVLGALPGAISFPEGIAIGSDGSIYVSSSQAVLRIVLE